MTKDRLFILAIMFLISPYIRGNFSLRNLCVACLKGNMQKAEEILNTKVVDVNGPWGLGYRGNITPLHYLILGVSRDNAYCDRTKVADLLLGAQADPFARENQCKAKSPTPFSLLCSTYGLLRGKFEIPYVTRECCEIMRVFAQHGVKTPYTVQEFNWYAKNVQAGITMYNSIARIYPD